MTTEDVIWSSDRDPPVPLVHGRNLSSQWDALAAMKLGDLYPAIRQRALHRIETERRRGEVSWAKGQATLARGKAGLDAPIKTINDNKHSGGDGPPIAVTVSPEQALAELREELADNPELLKKLVGGA